MSISTKSASSIKVADEVWIAAASLQRDYPDKSDFSIEEIVERARENNLYPFLRPGVYVHVVQHCVANRPPSPGRYRMLLETASGRRRLFRPGDAYHPRREGAKITPALEDLPQRYSELFSWYRHWSAATALRITKDDPLLLLRGSGRQLWSDEHADEYVRRLREGWE